MSALFKNTTMYGTPTWRANKMCSRVCGIGPSAAETTKIAPSICAAPVIMFFHVVRVPRTVHVRVVTRLALVLHVRRGNRDPARTLLRRLVNLVVGLELPAKLLRHHLRQGRRQGRLAVINMPKSSPRSRAASFAQTSPSTRQVPLRNLTNNNKNWEPTNGIEPLTSSLTKDVLYQLSYVGRIHMERVMGIEPT